MSNDYPPPGSGQEPVGENQPPPPPPPPSGPQWNPQSPGTPSSDPNDQQQYGQPGYGQSGYGQSGQYGQSYGQQPYGQPPSYPPQPPGGYGNYGQPVQTSPLAIVSLVLGIVGLLCCTFFVLGIAAAVTGFIARKQINESQGRQKGSGMALAGLILGVVSVLLALAYWALVITGVLTGNFNFETT